MDPEEIEKKIKEHEKIIAEELNKGQLKLRAISTLQQDANKIAAKIQEHKHKVEALRDILGK